MSSSISACKARILLGVWGESFIETFLQYSLPSLLAPGNIPALAAEFSTTFVVLTRPSDHGVFESSPLFQKLKSICNVEFISIKDIILYGNYATTLTLAYDRAIRQMGDEMLSTYFIFLTSDYVMADGSMRGLMKYIRQGYSGICAGNFQVIEEEINPVLKTRIDANSGVMTVSPRELLSLSLPHLHAVTYASFYDQPYLHNYKANRFFLRHDQDVIAGRFYLLHMLCIKPELTNYRVGASCDYSFIPEMCPSGNIAVINDSDDYLVIETQPREHEVDVLSWGPYQQQKLVSALSEWTTAQHRENAKHTIYFHARDLDETEKQSMASRLNDFTQSIDDDLRRYPVKPYYDHPFFWIGSEQGSDAMKDFLKKYDECEYINYQALGSHTTAKRLFTKIFGQAPQVLPWHYRWHEYRTNLMAVKKFIATNQCHQTLVLYGSYQQDYMGYRSWLQNSLGITQHYLRNPLQESPQKIDELHAKQFDSCIILESIGGISNIGRSLDLAKRIIKPDSEILLMVFNDRQSLISKRQNLLTEFANRISDLVNTSYQITEMNAVRNQMTLLGFLAIDNINKAFSYSRKKRFLAYILVGLPVGIFTILYNGTSRLLGKVGHCTNILINLSAVKHGRA